MSTGQSVSTRPRSSAEVPAHVARIRAAIAKYPHSRWRRLVAWFYEHDDQRLRGPDIAEMSLVCAEGLPQSHEYPQGILARLDDWTRVVRRQTERWWGAFEKDPGAFESSPNRYRMVVMKTVLSCRFKVYCDFSHCGHEIDNRDSRYRFIHGPLTGIGGTCSSLTFLCAAIGRRIGYPLRLVRTIDHYFVRWDEPHGERFNIECTTPGFVSHSDEHYRNWGIPFSDDDLANWPLLASLSPREELASFLDLRARCLRDNLDLDEAEETSFHAAWLAPRALYVRVNSLVVSMMRRLIQLAEERGNRDGPLSPAVEQVPYPEPANLDEAWAVTVTRNLIARLRRYHSPGADSSASWPGIVQTVLQH